MTEDAERSEEEGVGGRNKKAFLPSIQTACPGVTGALDKELFRTSPDIRYLLVVTITAPLLPLKSPALNTKGNLCLPGKPEFEETRFISKACTPLSCLAFGPAEHCTGTSPEHRELIPPGQLLFSTEESLWGVLHWFWCLQNSCGWKSEARLI